MIKLTSGVALLHYGRAGSTLIATMIAQNKLFYFDGEIYERLRTGDLTLPENNKNRPGDLLLKRRNKYFYRDYLVSIKPIPEEHLRPDLLNMSYSRLLALLDQAKIDKIIIIKRENYLKQVLSHRLALEWKKWHFKSHEKSEIIKVRLNCTSFNFGVYKGELLELFRRFDDYYSNMIEETPSALILNYERDIESDPYVAYNKIKEYLNLNKNRPNITLSRSNVFENESVIENYDEVKEYFAGSIYEWMV